MNSPKEKWIMFNLIQGVLDFWDGPKPSITMDTDVNAVAKFEFSHGGHKANKNLCYITVGTGVGVGLVINGETVTGLTHPEGGHVCVTRHPRELEGFKSVCRFHDNCVEGFTTNVSIAKRYNLDVEELPNIKDDDIVWELVAHYLATLCAGITLTCSPEVIVIGGGVMNRKILYKLIHKEFIHQMKGYITHDLLTEQNVDKYIVRSQYENECGIYSALALAE
jgi:fructokinase